MAARSGQSRQLNNWTLIVVGALLSLVAGLSLWALSSDMFQNGNASFEIIGWEFELTEQGRRLQVHLQNTSQAPLNLDSVKVNGTSILTWDISQQPLLPQDEAFVFIQQPFAPAEPYQIAIHTRQSGSAAFEVVIPDIEKRLGVHHVETTSDPAGALQIDVSWEANGFAEATFILEPFTNATYEQLPIYVFADEKFLSPRSTKHLNALSQAIERLQPSLNIEFIDNATLAVLSEAMQPCVLILFTSLQGTEVVDHAVPAALLTSSEGEQQGLGHLQDWIEAGLVLVTPMTTHPLRALVVEEGRIEKAPSNNPSILLFDSLSTWWSVTAEPTEAFGAGNALFRGRYRGDYGAVGQLLATGNLYGYAETMNQFDSGPAQIRNQELLLYNPFFIRKGHGGWLAFSDRNASMETLTQDLVMTLLHKPWLGQPLSALNPVVAETFQLSGGRLDYNQRLTLPVSPSRDDVRLRVLLWAEDEDTNQLHWTSTLTGALP